MKNNLLLLLTTAAAVSLLGCTKETNEPIAELKYLSIEKRAEPYYFDLRFSSNIDLDSIFNRSKNISRTHSGLYCSLEQPAIFKMDHPMQAYGYGILYPEKSNDQANSYRALFTFIELDDRNKEIKIPTSRVLELTQGRPTIACRVMINAWSYNAYYTHEFQLPLTEAVAN